jgi:hypothetical protein
MIKKVFMICSIKINAFKISTRKDVRMDEHLGYHSEFYYVFEM